MAQKSDKHTIEGVNNRETPDSTFPIGRVVFVVLFVACLIFPFTAPGKSALQKVKTKLLGEPVEKVVEKIKTVEVPGPERIVEVKIPVIQKVPQKVEVLTSTNHSDETTQPVEDLRKMSRQSEINLKTYFKADKVDAIASKQRGVQDGYTIEYKLNVKLPKAAQSVEEIETLNPSLSSMLPGIKDLVKDAKVSPYYYSIYENKVNRLKRDAPKLKSLLSRHNFYDLQTVLNMETSSGRKVMLMQADMDVVSDGSDGDRLPTMPDKIVNSSYYQPFTSYGWKKQTTTPNPMIKGWKKRLRKATVELSKSSTPAARKAWLRDRIKMLKRGISDLKVRSYLIAEHDPFIVIPSAMLTNMDDKFAPKVGDYAVVIYKEKLYPCIVGDGGPDFKVGEASLRMAKALNKRAGIYSRPVSDVSVTYLVFPFSREKTKSAPDYETWRTKCESLLNEIGGLSQDYKLEKWESTFPKK